MDGLLQMVQELLKMHHHFRLFYLDKSMYSVINDAHIVNIGYLIELNGVKTKLLMNKHLPPLILDPMLVALRPFPKVPSYSVNDS